MSNNEIWYKDLLIDKVKVTFKINTGININVLGIQYIILYR